MVPFFCVSYLNISVCVGESEREQHRGEVRLEGEGPERKDRGDAMRMSDSLLFVRDKL